jgi:hypothetical protein
MTALPPVDDATSTQPGMPDYQNSRGAYAQSA